MEYPSLENGSHPPFESHPMVPGRRAGLGVNAILLNSPGSLNSAGSQGLELQLDPFGLDGSDGEMG